MVNIYIARHGETEYNRTNRIQGRGINESINDRGARQAEAVAEELKDCEIDAIFCSSLKRSLETAEIIGEQLQLPVSPYSELDEMDFGVIEGQPIDEIKEELNRLHKEWHQGDTGLALEEGESPEGVLERVLLRVDDILANHPEKNILFVLHGRLIRILLSHWLGYGLSQMHRVSHQNGGLYHIRQRNDGSMQAVYLNKNSHLADI